jgi:transglutaminase-like putative cysteine protease
MSWEFKKSSLIKMSAVALTLAAVLLPPRRVQAAGEFVSDYEVTYRVEESGLTRATYKVSLTNQTERYYATEYTMQLGTSDVAQVSARDPGGPVPLTIEKGEDSTKIRLTFNDQVVGKGKILPWQLDFLTHDYAKKVGQIWEIDIPPLSKTEAINNYAVYLVVPATFGQPAYMFPKPTETTKGEDGVRYTFAKEDYLKHGVSAAFGKFQLFSFNLAYHLKNPRLYPVKTKIALPPDTPYQTIVLESLVPKPVNIAIDEDGNWIADYQLAAGEVVNIVASGEVKLFAKAKTNKVPLLSAEARQRYLSQQEYWEVDDPQIKELARKLKTPEKIYDYVVSTLGYDQSRLEGNLVRMGAAKIIQQPKTAVCMEFTDLFIALSRAAGIPAREINGYAYTSDPRRRPLSLARLSGDILHAWPEYYDEERGWVPVDPTWGSTTRGRDYFHNFDLNHVVFAIHGSDSEWPPAAGAYKFDASQQNDVKISFAQPPLQTAKEPVVSFKLPERLISGLPVKGSLEIKNLGNVVYPQSSLQIESDFFTIDGETEMEISAIPPFGLIQVPISLRSPRVTRSKVSRLEVRFDGQRFSHQVVAQPFFLVDWRILIGGGAVGTIGLFFIAKRAGGLLVQRRK